MLSLLPAYLESREAAILPRIVPTISGTVTVTTLIDKMLEFDNGSIYCYVPMQLLISTEQLASS